MKSLSKYVVAQKSASVALLDGLGDPLDGQGIFGADVEEAFASADGPGGDCHAFDDAVGERFQQHAVHECAGIAFVAVADDVFHIALSGADFGPLDAGGKTGAAAAAQAAGFDFIDDLLRREFFQAAAQGFKAVVAQVFVEIRRIDLAAVFGGHVFLPAEECTDRRIADVDGMPGDRIAVFVAYKPIEPARGGICQAGA